MITNTVQLSSKDQERKALEKIRKIVDELGPDSYVGTAFDGCFEIAEANIENDFADSFRAELDKLRSEHATLKSELESAREIAIHNVKQCDEARNELIEFQRRIEKAEDEVIHLKAKLYDAMVGA